MNEKFAQMDVNEICRHSCTVLVPIPDEGQLPGFALSIALAFLPTIINLLLLFVLKGASHETR
jgi:hypothetical protein